MLKLLLRDVKEKKMVKPRFVISFSLITDLNKYGYQGDLWYQSSASTLLWQQRQYGCEIKYQRQFLNFHCIFRNCHLTLTNKGWQFNIFFDSAFESNCLDYSSSNHTEILVLILSLILSSVEPS